MLIVFSLTHVISESPGTRYLVPVFHLSSSARFSSLIECPFFVFHRAPSIVSAYLF